MRLDNRSIDLLIVFQVVWCCLFFSCSNVGLLKETTESRLRKQSTNSEARGFSTGSLGARLAPSLQCCWPLFPTTVPCSPAVSPLVDPSLRAAPFVGTPRVCFESWAVAPARSEAIWKWTRSRRRKQKRSVEGQQQQQHCRSDAHRQPLTLELSSVRACVRVR